MKKTGKTLKAKTQHQAQKTTKNYKNGLEDNKRRQKS